MKNTLACRYVVFLFTGYIFVCLAYVRCPVIGLFLTSALFITSAFVFLHITANSEKSFHSPFMKTTKTQFPILF